MTARIAVPGGGIWVRPSLASDDENGLGWKLRYTPDLISRADQLTIADILDAYDYLLLVASGEQRDRVVREVRLSIKRENPTQPEGVTS